MRVNIWERDKPGADPADGYDFATYRPAKGPLTYKAPYKNGFRENKWLWQIAVSSAVLLLVLVLVKGNLPFTGSLKNGIKYLVTSETDLRPAFQKIVQLSGQLGNMEWPLVDDVPPGTQTTMTKETPAAGLALPASGRLLSTYGWNMDPDDQVQRFHEGIDIAVPAGTAVKASADGEVARTGQNVELGRYILVKGQNGESVRYANLSEILVKKGRQVRAGDVIARSGLTGQDEPHIHFELMVNGRPVDPLGRLGIDFTKTGPGNRTDVK